MKKFILFITLTALTLSPIFSQETTDTTSSLLWEISGKNVQQPSYLFGTMHILPKDQFYYPESLKAKITSSDVLVMEIAGLSEKMKALKYMMLDSGEVWDYFTAPQLDTLFQYANEKLGYSEEMMRRAFSKMKPFVLLQLMTKNNFGSQQESYELHFEKLAKQDSVPVLGLETIEEQMGFINKLDPHQQVSMIMQSIRDSNKPKENKTQQLIKVYFSQNIDKIRAFVSKSDMDSPEFESTFLTNRNKSWIKPIQKIIKSNKAFIAVGAAHLGGKDGVVELLRKKGYTLTPVKF